MSSPGSVQPCAMSTACLRARTLKPDGLGVNPIFATYALWDLRQVTSPLCASGSPFEKGDNDGTNVIGLLCKNTWNRTWCLELQKRECVKKIKKQRKTIIDATEIKHIVNNFMPVKLKIHRKQIHS